jgi:hypothetical protein
VSLPVLARRKLCTGSRGCSVIQEKSGVGNLAIEKPAVWPKIDNQEAAREAAQENGLGSGSGKQLRKRL